MPDGDLGVLVRKCPWSRAWKWLAAITATSSVLLAVALVIVLAYPRRAAGEKDERLMGTWQSDAERTIAEFQRPRPLEPFQEKRLAALRKLFGKLRITYMDRTFTTELNGQIEIRKYRVLGRDKQSVVIRELDPQPSLDKLLGPNIFTWESEFTVIQFDGPDAYWVHERVGDIREYFKRVSP
jgi:hypothetical protein